MSTSPAEALCRILHRPEWAAPEPRTRPCGDCVTAADQMPTELLRPPRHGLHHVCPGCAADCSNAALTELAYTFTTCTCAIADYAHLIETVWHSRCLLATATKEDLAS